MFAFICSTILLFAAEAAHSESAWARFREFFAHYFNDPGFALWKWFNLAIFVGIGIYLAKKYKLSDSFKAKRDAIRADLIRAEEEKKAALERLTAIEARLANLESEKETILTRAKDESEAERRRLSEQTSGEIKRLREQAAAEIARLANQTRAELRRFSAEESIRLAEQKLRSEIGASDDARLVKASIQEIGGLN
jgi:F0F1-type ATP synthase membrane subunit b/b'